MLDQPQHFAFDILYICKLIALTMFGDQRHHDPENPHISHGLRSEI